ncbi:hypothetical protein, partial [Glutamicibacter arilaitensis]|uniref:hypothetical protein n=3 Tax=Glutamicibacter TaxID=1742989 RepID=UPI003FD0AA2A
MNTNEAMQDPARINIPPLANDHNFTRRTAMVMRAATRKTPMIGLCFMRVENGHIFGIEFVLAICVSFGGMFIGLFCLRAFIVRFTRPGG